MTLPARFHWVVVAGAAVLAAVAAWMLLHRNEGAPPGAVTDFGEIAVHVDPGNGEATLAWCLLAALDTQQRNRGLMEVTDLGPHPGMAFVYEEDVDNSFYMRDTPMPLSIAWISAAGAVVSTADMTPCGDRPDCPLYPPGGRYRYAIEVPQGQLDDLGITAAATVTVGGRCAAA